MPYRLAARSWIAEHLVYQERVVSHAAVPFVLCLCALLQVDGDLWRTAKFIDSVKIPYIAPSLGGVESLIEQPTVISYWDQVGEGWGGTS